MASPQFYIGRVFDEKTGKVTADTVRYDPADLTTHAFITGMTGSGKTGLCITLLEEAALQGIPAIVIDPKGDLTNLLLHFPNLAPEDFEPWIDPDMARREGKGVKQAASEASSNWRKGLAEWDIPTERIADLQRSVAFTVFTPGSDSGIPVSVLSSLAAPDLQWEGNEEALREQISSTVTALLGLVGYLDIDPVRSREHILLANIFELAWSMGRDVDLAELIRQVQSPPFEKLGALSVDAFFPSPDRNQLAVTINNILAAPAFQIWREGQPLDVQALLRSEDGRPRHAVFYLAHLPDAERMFFVTLLLAAVETWMRTQAGASTLRALLYMDEIHGYLPPVANPPSKGPLLRMLKQARAFGLGLMLATQNPVDMDYKALSNAGTWFVGKLQTERDKERLLDGLEGAGAGGSRASLDRSIGRLAKRVFLLHNVHSRGPILLHSRWAMNFLAGPLTRAQIPALNKLAGTAPAAPASRREAARAGAPTDESSLTRPPLAAGVREYFLPLSKGLPEAFAAAGRPQQPAAQARGIRYRAALLAAARVRILERRYGIDSEVERAVLIESPDRRGAVRWDEFSYQGPSLDEAEAIPAPDARFDPLDPPLDDGRLMTALQHDFTDWVYRNVSISVRANPSLKIYAGPEVSQADFEARCSEAAGKARDREQATKTATLDRQIKAGAARLAREERELQQDQQDLQNRKLEAGANLLELGAGFLGFGRKKSVGTQFTKQRLTQTAKADVEESVQSIEQLKKQLADLQEQRAALTAEIAGRWSQAAGETSEITITPKKTDVYVHMFGIAWLPHYLVDAGGEQIELPAYSTR